MQIYQRSHQPKKEKITKLFHYASRWTASEAQVFHPATCQDRYRIMYYNVLDTAVTLLNDRFNQSSFVVYKNIESLLLKRWHFLESEYIKRIYNDEINITQFKIEGDILRVVFYEKKVDCFDSFLSEIRKLPREQRLFLPCTVHMCKLLLVNQATTSTEDRSFSTERRIKTWTRSKMIPVRFNALSILYTHKTLTDNLDLKDIEIFFPKKVKEGV